MSRCIAGVDEVGRGALVGAVVSAAVVLPDDWRKHVLLCELKDSKKISPAKRKKLSECIKHHCRWAVGEASAQEIDVLNIHHATLLAMQRAVVLLGACDEVWVDGKYAPAISVPCKTFIKGDALHACISAASIVAKVHRDAAMIALDSVYPQYGFAQHKGYATRQHLAALERFGAIELHRRSFSPLSEMVLD